MENIDVRLVEPSMEHFEAFKKAQKAMYDYIGEENITEYHKYQNNDDKDKEPFKMDDTAKRESLDFSFTDAWYHNVTKEQFEERFVQFYKDRRVEGIKKPQEFYFMMVGDEIVGETSARSKPMDDVDKRNGLKPFKKWGDELAVEIGMCILPEYRGGGRGYADKAKKQLFDILRVKGVEEIKGTVVHGNIGSHKSQEKSLKNYGGLAIHTPEGKRYIISTDTTGNSIRSYDDRHVENIEKQREVRKNLGLDNMSSRVDMLQERANKLKGLSDKERLEVRTNEHKEFKANQALEAKLAEIGCER